MPKFNKRHYEAIASLLQHLKPAEIHPQLRQLPHEGWQHTCAAFAQLFASDNHLFKRDRFLAACQPGANVKARTRFKVAS